MHPQLCELGLRGDRHRLSEPTTCFRIMGKEIFHKSGPIIMPKRIGYKISMIFCDRNSINTFSNKLSVQEMKFIIDTFSDAIGACTVTHNVLVGLPIPT